MTDSLGIMTTTRRKKNRDADNTFFLYVAFHSAWTAIANFFNHDDH